MNLSYPLCQHRVVRSDVPRLAGPTSPLDRDPEGDSARGEPGAPQPWSPADQAARPRRRPAGGGLAAVHETMALSTTNQSDSPWRQG